jgi:hypothetical protein
MPLYGPFPFTPLATGGSRAFWGHPYAHVPSSNGLRDSNGDLDPNWAVPFDALNPWDKAIINGMQVPGIVRFESHKAQRHQKRQALGDDYGNITQMGWDLAEVVMAVKIWTEKQFSDWQTLINQLETQLLQAKTAATAGASEYAGGMSAVTVDYPALAMHSISKLFVKDLSPLTQAGDPGVMQAKLSFTEFNPARQGTTVTAKGADPDLSANKSTFGNSGKQKNPAAAPPSANQTGGLGPNSPPLAG